MIAPLPLEAGPANIYVYYHTHGKTPILGRMLTSAQLAANDTLTNLMNGVVFGIMLASGYLTRLTAGLARFGGIQI